MEDVFAVIGVFGVIPLIIFLGLFFKSKARAKNVELVTAMLDKDKEVTPEIIRAVGFAGRRSHRDLRTGMILVATGLATLFLGGAIPEEEANAVFAGLAAFPTLIGVAFLLFWFIISRKDPE